MSLWIYLLENANYYLVTLVTLFLWDIIDLYIDLRNFDFIRRFPFISYYFIIGFFAIGTMEAGLLLNVFTIESKYLIAFLMPLVFAIFLENLVVKIGGGKNKTIDFSDFFDRFRFAIKEHLTSIDLMKKVTLQSELLKSKTPTEDIISWARFYSTEEQMKKLLSDINAMEPKTQRIEIIKFLISQAKTPDIIKCIQCQKNSNSNGKKS